MAHFKTLRKLARKFGLSPNIFMFDDVTVSLLPSGAEAYAAYTDGLYANFNAVARLFPKAHILGIAVFASDDATALDIEIGDAQIWQAPGWFNRQAARGVVRPVLYIGAANQAALEATMYKAGIAREKFRLWSAHYTGSPHFCGPKTCGYGLTQADATQYSDQAFGRSLDESVLVGDFFGAPPPPPKPLLWHVGTKGASLLHISQVEHVPVSTLLRWTVENAGSFSPGLTAYLAAGSLTAPLPQGEIICVGYPASNLPSRSGGQDSVAKGQYSLAQWAVYHKTTIAQILTWTVAQHSVFPQTDSRYIQGGDLTKPIPAGGTFTTS